MLLSDKRIVEELKSGNIIIEPFDERQLGTNSYDCRLGEWYFQGDMNIDVIHLDNPQDIRRYWGEAQAGHRWKDRNSTWNDSPGAYAGNYRWA